MGKYLWGKLLFYCMGKLVVGEVAVGEISNWGNFVGEIGVGEDVSRK